MHNEQEAVPASAMVIGEATGDTETLKMRARASPSPQQLLIPDRTLLFLLCAIGALEGADAVLLPSVFYALQVDLGLHLSNLALMSLVQALTMNLASPFWGILADRGIIKRKWIVCIGCIVQGFITMVLAGVDELASMVFLRGLNGVMLASLKPIANGIVADVTAESCRGKVFGAMQFAQNLGAMGGMLLGTNMARKDIGNHHGWRVAFLIVGGLSLLLGLVAGAIMQEPPRVAALDGQAGSRSRCGAFKAEARRFFSYFKMPSFCVLVIQGCFGAVPWNALSFSTLFFQIGGLSDLQASAIQVVAQISSSFGNLIGGSIGDRLSRWSALHGRPLVAQISVLSGIPVAWLVFMEEPPEGSAFAYYLLLSVVLGLTATWCLVGVNLPILSEIVKPGNRATIMAWEGALEGSCSAIFGNAMVGFLAETVFGYDIESAREAGSSEIAKDPANVRALGNALMLVCLTPWVVCFLSYSFLHWAYPRDILRVRKEDAKAAAADAAVKEAAQAAITS